MKAVINAREDAKRDMATLRETVRLRADERQRGKSDKQRDNEAVDDFSAAMKSKLEEKRGQGRGGWHDKTQCSQETLSRMLREHVEKGDPVDVANFAMMLHQRGERIASTLNGHSNDAGRS